MSHVSINKKVRNVIITEEQKEGIVQAVKDYNDYPFDEFLPLWNKIVAFLKKHVEFSDSKTYEVCTAWVFANWIPEVWETFPYLYFYGISESGKNQAWQTLAKISRKPVECASISGAGIFRSVRPEIMELKIATTKYGEFKEVKVGTGKFDYATLFMDELGILTSQSSENEQMKHQILDAGYKKGGSVIRCVGANFETKSFPVDGFKSIASVYMVPDALKSRCIMVRMVRTQKRFPLRHDENEVKDIVTGLTVWRLKAYQEGLLHVKNANPLPMSLEFDSTFIEELLFSICHNGRLVQLFYPLYRVAPVSRKGLILEILEEEGKAKVQTSLTSFEADIFSAVLDVHNKSPDSYVLFTTDILNAYNNEHSDAPIKVRTMKREVESLGFKPYRTAKRNGFLHNKELIEKLEQRFQFSGTSGDNGTSGTSVEKGITTENTLAPYTETPQAPQTARICPSCHYPKGMLTIGENPTRHSDNSITDPENFIVYYYCSMCRYRKIIVVGKNYRSPEAKAMETPESLTKSGKVYVSESAKSQYNPTEEHIKELEDKAEKSDST